MAINTQQFLNRPSTKLHRKYSGKLAMKEAMQKKMVGGAKSIVISQKSLIVMETKVIKIRDLLKSSLVLEGKETGKKRIKKEREAFDKKEKELEKKEGKDGGGRYKLPGLPRLGMFDRIKNFFMNALLGYVAVRMLPHVNKLPGIITGVGYAIDFATNFFVGLVDGLGTFLQKGYEAYDATRGFIKTLGGDDTVKKFDQFAGLIDNVLTTAMIVALATADSGGGEGPGGGRGGGPRKGGGGRYGFGRDSLGRDMTDWGFKHGKDGGTGWQGFNLAKQRGVAGIGVDKAQGDIMKRYFQKYGRDAFVQRFGEEGLKRLPGGMQRGLLQRGARSAFVGLVGKGGAKAVLGFVRPLLKRLPIIGALIDFGLSVALGEDPGRAAFKAIGAGLLGTVGAAIGSLAFGFGGIVGGILGSIGGDMIGGALYDAFFKGKKPTPKKIQGRAQGGSVTRGGKLAGGPAKRTFKKQKAKRAVRATPRKLKPGASVGGEKGIEKVFPSSNDSRTVSTMGYIKTFYDKTSVSPSFGPIFSIATKALVGDEPTSVDFRNAGAALNNWLSQTFSVDTMRTVGGFAGGGEVNAEMFMKGGDLSGIISKSIEESVTKSVDSAIQDLRKQMGLDVPEREQKLIPGQQPDEVSPDGGGGLTGGNWGPLLDVIAAGEGGYESVNPGFTIPGLTKMTIAEADRQAQRMGRAKGGTGAMGRYQLLSDPVGRARKAGLDPNKDLFSPTNQDKIAVYIIEDIRKGREWLSGKISDQDFLQGIANEWASMPNYYGRYSYSGQGGAIKADKLKTALAKVKKGGYSQQEITDSIATSGGIEGYKVTRSGATITNYSQLAPHHDYQSTADGRRVQDFTLYKGDKFLNVPVPAPVSGKVTWTGPAGGGGNWVEIQSKSGKVELGHFNKIIARPGQTVQAFRSIIGLQGYTGNISPSGPDGTHVHIQAPENIVSRYVNTLGKSAKAYFLGGRILKPTFATLAEKGPEFVFDTDTTKGLDSMAPLLLDRLNAAKSKKQLSNILSSYASYEDGGERVVEVQQTTVREKEVLPIPLVMGMGSGGFGGGSGESDTNYDFLINGY